jgi:hypothetical protein
MTQSTDRDITEIKSAIESIARSTEANTKAIATLSSQVADLTIVKITDRCYRRQPIYLSDPQDLRLK